MNSIKITIQSNASILSCALHFPGADDEFVLLSRSGPNDFLDLPDGPYGVSIASTAQPPGTPIVVTVTSTNNQIVQNCAIQANGTIATMVDFALAGGTVA